jgi:hypothetical protein
MSPTDRQQECLELTVSPCSQSELTKSVKSSVRVALQRQSLT